LRYSTGKKRGGSPQAKGYSEAGASYARRALKSFIAMSGAPTEDIDNNNKTLRQRSRMLYMAAPIATSAINTNRTKIVGTGLVLKSTVDRDVLGISADAAKAWQRKTEAEFMMWASKKENCDATGVNNFDGLQQLALKSWLMSGDVFPLFKRYDPTPTNPYTLRIHLIEADRISTPDSFSVTGGAFLQTSGKNTDTGNMVYDGVEVDKNGMIVAYHICNIFPQENTLNKAEWTRVEAYGKKTGLPNILHVMDSERPDQYRGVPYLAQVIEPLLQLRRYTESELMSALVQSFFSAWITTGTDASQMPINEVGAGDDADEVSQSENEYSMGPGTIVYDNLKIRQKKQTI